MKSIIKICFALSLILSYNIALSQISIPYGDDAILIKNSSRIDLRFELDGRSWNCRYLSYFFINGTNDVAGTEEYDAVRRAFDTWSAVTNLDFIEACNEEDADIRIMWAVGNHGDGVPFDDGGTVFENVLAHGFFPPPNSGAFAGDLHFDDFEDWRVNGNDIDVETVALHELGHSLGLRHSDVNNSVMEPVYEGLS